MHVSHIRSLVVFASAALAVPVENCLPKHGQTPPETAVPALPSTGSTDLPAPAAGLTLKYLAIGHGLQNYTCANISATPAAAGALAVLYDATALYSMPTFDSLSSDVLWNTPIPLNLQNQDAAVPPPPGTTTTLTETDFQADTTAPFCALREDLSFATSDGQIITVPFLGEHFFDASGVPNFDLVTASLYIAAAKTGSAKAPTTADTGLLATGAVDWLALGDNGLGATVGLSEVYRVVTAGGGAQACSESGATPAGQMFSVPYAAQYWFYG